MHFPRSNSDHQEGTQRIIFRSRSLKCYLKVYDDIAYCCKRPQNIPTPEKKAMVAVVFAAWKAREARMKALREAARAAEEPEKDKDESSTPKPDAAVPEKQEEDLGGAPDCIYNR